MRLYAHERAVCCFRQIFIYPRAIRYYCFVFFVFFFFLLDRPPSISSVLCYYRVRIGRVRHTRSKQRNGVLQTLPSGARRRRPIFKRRLRGPATAHAATRCRRRITFLTVSVTAPVRSNVVDIFTLDKCITDQWRFYGVVGGSMGSGLLQVPSLGSVLFFIEI